MKSLLLYTTALLFRTIGCLISKKWLVIWFWIELRSLAIIPLIRSKVKPRSIEATTKYFLFQAIGRVMLLLGIFFRTMVRGNLEFRGKYDIIRSTVIVLGLFIKMGIFPGHFWFIDVMQGVKLFSGFFLSIISKIIPLYIIILIRRDRTALILLVLGIIRVFIGSSFGVQQTQLRKLIALSSISHLGWMILVFARTPKIYLGVALFVSYAVMTLPIFWIGKKFSMSYISKTSKVLIRDIEAKLFIVRILSIAGFPPLLGFFYKWVMLSFLSVEGNFLVIRILILSRLLSLYFYLQICVSLYFNSWPMKKTAIFGAIKKEKKRISIFLIRTKVFVYSAIFYFPVVSTKWVA